MSAPTETDQLFLDLSPSLTDKARFGGYIVPEWDARIHGTIWRARLPGHSEVKEA